MPDRKVFAGSTMLQPVDGRKDRKEELEVQLFSGYGVGRSQDSIVRSRS